MPIDPFEHYPLGPDAPVAVSALSLTYGIGLVFTFFPSLKHWLHLFALTFCSISPNLPAYGTWLVGFTRIDNAICGKTINIFPQKTNFLYR